jgi:hypothetical protein
LRDGGYRQDGKGRARPALVVHGRVREIDLNAPGGIADYIHRSGPAYHEMARSAGAPEKWSDALTARLEAERRQTLSSDKLGERAVVGPSIDGTAGAQTEGAGEDWRLTGLADRVIPPSALRRQS